MPLYLSIPLAHIKSILLSLACAQIWPYLEKTNEVRRLTNLVIAFASIFCFIGLTLRELILQEGPVDPDLHGLLYCRYVINDPAWSVIFENSAKIYVPSLYIGIFMIRVSLSIFYLN